MYVKMRTAQTDEKRVGYMYITPRTLLGIIRLSQALARINFRNEVDMLDINESIRLIEASRSSIIEEGNTDNDPLKGNIAIEFL
jgi:DNA replication licensing factor MCM7